MYIYVYVHISAVRYNKEHFNEVYGVCEVYYKYYYLFNYLNVTTWLSLSLYMARHCDLYLSIQSINHGKILTDCINFNMKVFL